MRPATFWFSVLFQTFEYDCVDLSLFFFFICSTFGQNSLIRKEERGRGRCSHFLRVPSCRFGMWLQSVISFRVSLFLFVYYWYYLMFWLYDVSTDGRHKSFYFLNFFVMVFFWLLFDLARGQERGVHHRLSAWQHWLFAEFVWFCSWRRIDWPAASGGCGWGLLFVCCLSALKKGKQIFCSEKAVYSWV